VSFKVFLHPKAARLLDRLTAALRSRIKQSLKELEDSPESKGQRLKGSTFWRLRVGEYRAIYEIDGTRKRVVVLFVGHRRDVYDEFSRILD
jgi:mRNA interferase RelE/StbE